AAARQGFAEGEAAPAVGAAFQRQGNGEGTLRRFATTCGVEDVRHGIETPHPAELHVAAEQLFDGAVDDGAHTLLLLRFIEDERALFDLPRLVEIAPQGLGIEEPGAKLLL